MDIKKTKHIPERMCTGCRKMVSKPDLIRIVENNSKPFLDCDQKVQKRGLYICKNEECISLIKKKRVLNKLIKGEVCEEFFEELIEFAKR